MGRSRGTVTVLPTVLSAVLLLAGCAADEVAPDEGRDVAVGVTPTPVGTPDEAAPEPSEVAVPVPSPSRAAAPSPSAPPSGAPPGSPGEFVRVVRAQLPEVAQDRDDVEIAALATGICADLAAGRPAADVLAEAQSLGTLDAEAVAPATARELVGLAVDTDCLDQAGRLDEP